MMFRRARFLSSDFATCHGAQGVSLSQEHVVPRPGVIIPASVGLKVHFGQFPDLAPIVDPSLQAPGLFIRTHFEPIFEEDDS